MSNPLDVADVRSNAPEHIDHAVKVIGRSKHRLKMFEAIYRGKKKIKTCDELERVLTEVDLLNRKVRVLQVGGDLVANQIVKPVKAGRPLRTAYEKIPFYSKNYRKIIKLAKNPQRAKDFVTKRNPQPMGMHVMRHVIRYVGKQKAKHEQISIDEIDSFSKVRNFNDVQRIANKWKENDIKKLFQTILEEKGDFKDWGGEYSDLFTTKVKVNGKRVSTAMAFKGRATSGKLTPEKMGKRGTQIERLFQEPAQLFLIAYHGQVDARVLSQMEVFALGKAMGGRKVYYGIIDGSDLDRIIAAYGSVE